MTEDEATWSMVIVGLQDRPDRCKKETPPETGALPAKV